MNFIDFVLVFGANHDVIRANDVPFLQVSTILLQVLQQVLLPGITTGIITGIITTGSDEVKIFYC